MADNNITQGTSLQQSEPILCANGCGFFGTPATNNLCSKCFRDLRMKQESGAEAKVAFDKFAEGTEVGKTPFAFGWASESTSAVDNAPSAFPRTPAERHGEAAAVSTCAAGVGKKVSNRCGCCNKKVGMLGFSCRCGVTFCGTHRYPEKHDCSFDYKAQGREAIAKANPVVKGDKIQRF